MANKNNRPKVTDRDIEKSTKDISMLDRITKNLLTSVDPSFTNRQMIGAKDQKFQSIINRELDIAKGVSGGSIIDFIATINDANTKRTQQNASAQDTASLFTNDIGEIFGYFQDLYRNRYLELTDLKLISKFIPSIGEAVKTVLDGIVSSDDMSTDTVKRTLYLPETVPEDDRKTIIAEMEKFEKDQNILKKLKNEAYKKALVSGEHSCYAIPYKDLFEEYERVKATNTDPRSVLSKKGPGAMLGKGPGSNAGFVVKNQSANEALIPYIDADTGSFQMGNYVWDNAGSALESMKLSIPEKKALESNIKDHIGSFSIYGNPLESAMEEFGALQEYHKSFQRMEVVSTNDNATVDGTYSMGDVNVEKFDKTTGLYVRWINAKNIFKFKLFGEVVGYYYVHPTPKKRKMPQASGMMSVNSSLFNSTGLSESRREQAIQTIVDTICDGIVANFSESFVQENREFKKTIADCIIANGIVDNDYNIQFIPAKYIIQFTVNENEEGDGESMLSDSLFPAKLLLSLIVCKMLNYFNKSGSRLVSHVYKGPIDNNSYNQVQRVVRMLQDSNVTFNDLLSTNMVFSKFARDSNIQLPTSRDGKHLIEFEQQDGQEVDLSTPMEDRLEKMALAGTGVPNVVMDVMMESADFAKQILTGHIKLAGRVSSYQSDLEPPTTELYKKHAESSTLPENLKVIVENSFEFRLTRPRVLSNANNSDFLNTLTSLANMLADTMIGTAGVDEQAPVKKDKLVKRIVVGESPYINWNEIETYFRQVELEIAQESKVKPVNASGEGTEETDSMNDDMFS